jgi:hypothetical protein
MSPRLLRPRPARAPVPRFWAVLCQERLHTTPGLAEELWRAYIKTYPYKEQTLRFELDRLLSPAPAAVIEARLERLSRLISVGDLLKAAAVLSPENPHHVHARRRPDIVRFEETLLRYVHDGHWR